MVSKLEKSSVNKVAVMICSSVYVRFFHCRVSILILDQIIRTLISFLGKLYHILDQNSSISIPYPRLNCLKTIPFTAAHDHIAYIWECPPPPPTGSRANFPNSTVQQCIRLYLSYYPVWCNIPI